MKNALILTLAFLSILAFGQDGGDSRNTHPQAAAASPITVSVKAKATDARAVIADIFAQAKHNYVIQPGIEATLFLSLTDVEFEEALNIVCEQAKLQFQVQNGIYFITKKPIVAAAVPAAPKRILDRSVLARRLTAKFNKADIRLVLAAFGKQTEVNIEVDKSVPNYKLDAILNHTTLRFALDKVTEAAGLQYKFTDNLAILIYKPEDVNKVAVTGG